MKKLFVTMLGLVCALSLTANAAEGEKHKLSAEDKAARKELVDKYDTNKDGKLDKEERSKMTKEDKEKWEKVGGGHKKKDASADASASSSSK
jgi:hypothetical protein